MDTQEAPQVGQVVRIRPNRPAPSFDAIVREIFDGRALVEFAAPVGTQTDWVTFDMIEVPR